MIAFKAALWHWRLYEYHASLNIAANCAAAAAAVVWHEPKNVSIFTLVSRVSFACLTLSFRSFLRIDLNRS